jgi:serine phosphatase RsbU (regulator of sigma subunit)
VADHPIAIGVASRPHPAETVNGDAYAVHWSGETCRIAVIDGLGHGVEAARASAAAIAVLDAHPDLDPAEALRRCHPALVGTRGAAIAIARLDLGQGELVYAGVGNVEGHLWSDGLEGRHERLISYRGIVGSAMRTVRAFTMPLSGDWALLMHSDGISTRADLSALNFAPPWDPDDLAQAVMGQYSRPLDDALAVVALPRR